MRIGVLGGGVSGLTLANLLAAYDVEVLEADSRPGGLCQSFEVDGFWGDYGGHILFSKDDEALAYVIRMLGANVHQVRRENRVLYKGRYVKYPFENDLAALPVEDRYECLYHFLMDQYPQPTNLEEWCYSTFGKGISDAYLLPYNRKIWKTEPRELSMAWVERIPKPPKEDVIKSAIGISTEGYTHQLFFHYPKRGGIESLVHGLRKGARHVTTGFRVTDIARDAAGWIVKSATGETRAYDRLISAIPLHDLFNAMKFADPEVASVVRELRYNSIAVVLVGLNVPRRMNITALYVPDPAIIFHRICYMDFFSDQNCPEGCSSMLAEVTYGQSDEGGLLSDAELADRVVDDLVKIEQLDRKDVVNVVVKRQKYGYVVNDLEYENRLQKIYAYLESIDLPFCGRFAEFRYYNTDGCVRSAFSVAEKFEKKQRAT